MWERTCALHGLVGASYIWTLEWKFPFCVKMNNGFILTLTLKQINKQPWPRNWSEQTLLACYWGLPTVQGSKENCLSCVKGMHLSTLQNGNVILIQTIDICSPIVSMTFWQILVKSDSTTQKPCFSWTKCVLKAFKAFCVYMSHPYFDVCYL